MTKIRNPKPVLVIDNWNLRFICNLVLGVWDSKDSSTHLTKPQHSKRRTFLYPPQSGSFTLVPFIFG